MRPTTCGGTDGGARRPTTQHGSDDGGLSTLLVLGRAPLRSQRRRPAAPSREAARGDPRQHRRHHLGRIDHRARQGPDHQGADPRHQGVPVRVRRQSAPGRRGRGRDRARPGGRQGAPGRRRLGPGRRPAGRRLLRDRRHPGGADRDHVRGSRAARPGAQDPARGAVGPDRQAQGLPARRRARASRSPAHGPGARPPQGRDRRRQPARPDRAAGGQARPTATSASRSAARTSPTSG